MSKKSQEKKSKSDDQKALVPVEKALVPKKNDLVPTEIELEVDYECLVEVDPREKADYWGETAGPDFRSIFTSPQVRESFGIKKERLRQWIKGGYVKPSIRPSSGPGTDNIFSYADLFNIGLFKKMIDLGLNRWIASQWVLKLKEKDWKKVRNGRVKYIAIKGDIDRNKDWKKSMKLITAKDMPPDLDSDDFVLIMNLNKLMKNVERDIAEIVFQEN